MGGGDKPKFWSWATWRTTRTWVAALSIALVAAFVLLDTEWVAPGPLAAVHAREADLAGPNSCGACHGGIFESMAGACSDCHEDVDRSIADARGVHGALDEKLASDCGRCHGEHHGARFQMVSQTAFTLAGIDDVGRYDHAGLDYGLTGRHVALACEQCHSQAWEEVLAVDSQRFLGLVQTCTACHEDVHKGEYGQDCAACHGQVRPFPEMGGIAHAALCPLEGEHAAVSCEECHVPEGTYAVQALVARHVSPGPFDPPPRACAECHEQPHGARFLDGVAGLVATLVGGAVFAGTRLTDLTEMSVSRGTEPTALAMSLERSTSLAALQTIEPSQTVCTHCHGSFETFAGYEPSFNRPVHEATGFPLAPPHHEVSCGECHEGLLPVAELVPVRAAAEPAAVSAPAEGLANASGAPPPAEPALDADGRARSVPTDQPLPPYDPDVLWPHFRTRFPDREADDCAACHADPHDREFLFGAFREGGCLACHDRQHWTPSAIDVRRHDDASFVLRGAHAEAECNACHIVPVGLPERSEDGRLLRVFVGTPGACADCHRAPHAAAFLEQVAARAQDSGAAATCEECHRSEHLAFVGTPTEEGSRALHAASGLPLELPHDKPACAECHEGFGQEKLALPVTVPDPGSARLALAALLADGGRESLPWLATDSSFGAGVEFPAWMAAFPGRAADECQACHEDPHESQFLDGPFASAGCLECHERHAFFPAGFGPEEHARCDFLLDGAHLAVSCNECHPLPGEMTGTPWAAAAAAALTLHEARLFAGVPSACEACHTDAHQARFDEPPLPAEHFGTTGCARCHVTENFTQIPEGRFDHGQWTGYVLEGAHLRAQCTACHSPSRRPDEHGRRFGRAAGTECIDCHEDSHVGQFLVDGVTECTRCHVTRNTFADLVFDHQLHSRFPLDENHVQLECSACHKPYTLPDGRSTVRYKPLGVLCGDCHDPRYLPEDPPARSSIR